MRREEVAENVFFLSVFPFSFPLSLLRLSTVPLSMEEGLKWRQEKKEEERRGGRREREEGGKLQEGEREAKCVHPCCWGSRASFECVCVCVSRALKSLQSRSKSARIDLIGAFQTNTVEVDLSGIRVFLFKRCSAAGNSPEANQTLLTHTYKEFNSVY